MCKKHVWYSACKRIHLQNNVQSQKATNVEQRISRSNSAFVCSKFLIKHNKHSFEHIYRATRVYPKDICHRQMRLSYMYFCVLMYSSKCIIHNTTLYKYKLRANEYNGSHIISIYATYIDNL